ncbi:PLDc N-terminal domain-containing protein [Microbacterium sp. R86528]|uniref:PLDc N-terminal domain-containing protein n=1 Tax=Microbacterium sp. R86528 TaxID=3093864 RepID=UPI0037CA8BE8
MTNKKVRTPAGRLGFGVLTIAQLAFAFLALWDLRMRRDRDVKGPKWMWVPAIMVNWIGPASYFLFGVKR